MPSWKICCTGAKELCSLEAADFIGLQEVRSFPLPGKMVLGVPFIGVSEHGLYNYAPEIAVCMGKMMIKQLI